MSLAAGASGTFDRANRHYCRWLAFGLVLGCLAANVAILGLNFVVLLNAGEGLSVADSLHRQMRTGGLQSSAFDDVTMSPLIKISRYEAFRPDVIVLGTSRVTQFRPNAFSANFVNMGMYFTLDRAPELAATLLKIHKPKLVLIGVDWFRFNEAYPQPDDIGPLRGEWQRRLTTWPVGLKALLAYRKHILLQPSRWLMQGKVSPRDYLVALLGLSPHIGIPAIAEASGMGPRGSRYYGRISDEHEEHWQFRRTLGDVRDGRSKHIPIEAVSEARWQLYRRMVELFQAAGVAVIPFMPPIANPVLDAMEKRGGYGIFADLRERLRAYHGFVHDFTRPASIGSSDCEFVDGMHGGEVTYLRLLSKLAEQHPEVAKAIDAPAIADRIVRYAGRATAYDHVPGGSPVVEVDFLGIGCTK